jgi:uncharacterized membrane protein
MDDEETSEVETTFKLMYLESFKFKNYTARDGSFSLQFLRNKKKLLFLNQKFKNELFTVEISMGVVKDSLKLSLVLI